MNRILHSKFGTAKKGNHGYYVITSSKEGNYHKLLHRLIWEDFYGCKIPDGYVIHHRNHIKTDNCILNLQLMREKNHAILHNKGKTLSEETKQKISESRTGITFSEEHKQKLSESLTGKTLSDETKKKISRANKNKTVSNETKQKISETHKGKTLSEEHKQKLSESHKGITHSIENKIKISKTVNTSGYFRVCKVKNKKCKQGFYWCYQYWENGKQKTICSVSLEKLEAKVKAKDLKWLKY